MRRAYGRGLRGLATVALAAAATFLGAREAHAFCRSTACDPATEDCQKDENGCPRTGPPLSWRHLPIQYRFHAPGSDKLDMDRAREAVRRAFQTWSNVTCRGKRTSLTFQEGDDIPGRAPLAGDNPANVSLGIYFRDDVWPYDNGEESLALTNQKYGTINGYIDYSDIEVNMTSRTFRLSDDQKAGIDFQAVITHEVGHYIGFAHSNVDGAIMAPSYCQSSDRCGTSTDAARALGADDIAAVCALYPPGGIAGVAYDDPAASSCSVAAGVPLRADEPLPSRIALAALGALGVVVVVRKRRDR
jgi:hypothetical protein